MRHALSLITPILWNLFSKDRLKIALVISVTVLGVSGRVVGVPTSSHKTMLTESTTPPLPPSSYFTFTLGASQDNPWGNWSSLQSPLSTRVMHHSDTISIDNIILSQNQIDELNQAITSSGSPIKITVFWDQNLNQTLSRTYCTATPAQMHEVQSNKNGVYALIQNMVITINLTFSNGQWMASSTSPTPNPTCTISMP